VTGPLGLIFGKALGEALEWGKLATVAAECAIGVVVITCFSKEVEVADKSTLSDGFRIAVRHPDPEKEYYTPT